MTGRPLVLDIPVIDADRGHLTTLACPLKASSVDAGMPRRLFHRPPVFDLPAAWGFVRKQEPVLVPG